MYFLYIYVKYVYVHIYIYILFALPSFPAHPTHDTYEFVLTIVFFPRCENFLSTCAYLCIGTSAHVCARVCVCTVQNCKTRWTDMCDPNTIIKLSGSLDEFPHKMTSSTRCGGSHVSGGHCMYALMCVLSWTLGSTPQSWSVLPDLRYLLEYNPTSSVWTII